MFKNYFVAENCSPAELTLKTFTLSNRVVVAAIAIVTLGYLKKKKGKYWGLYLAFLLVCWTCGYRCKKCKHYLAPNLSCLCILTLRGLLRACSFSAAHPSPQLQNKKHISTHTWPSTCFMLKRYLFLLGLRCDSQPQHHSIEILTTHGHHTVQLINSNSSERMVSVVSVVDHC